MFILTAEPKELTIVLILGPIRMDQLSQLKGIAGLGALDEVVKDPNIKVKEKSKLTTKVKPEGKVKPGGDE